MLSFVSLGLASDNAYAQINNNPTPDAPTTANPVTADDEEDLSCAIAKMGWILCPLIETSGQVGDSAFQLLSKTFLETEPELVSTTGAGGAASGTYQAWELARNIANIMFIAAFLIIILSQVTGRGIDNYGIKKTLPRLIIAAIAVNVSYFICQVMVDLSNILGYEIQNFLVGISHSVSDRVAMPASSGISLHTGDSPGTLAGIAAIVLASIAVVWIILPLLVSAIGVIVITAIVIVIILLLRKAFIVLLVVASPIAFVLYLLPNTEQYFRKWLSMFWKLLMVFPVVGILFGGGQLASAIVLVAGTNGASEQSVTNKYSVDEKTCIQLPLNETKVTNNTENKATAAPCGNQSTPLMLGLVAAGIAVAPLLAVWSVLKGALSGAGAIGGKISGAVDTYTNKGAGEARDKLKKTALGRGIEARKAIKQNYKDQNFASKMSGTDKHGRFTRIAARGVQGNLGRVVKVGSLSAQDSKLTANFAGAAQKIRDQEVGENESAIKARTHGNMEETEDILANAVNTGDELTAIAAKNLLMGMGNTGVDHALKIIGTYEESDGANGKVVESIKENIRLHHAGIKGQSAAADTWVFSPPKDRNGNAVKFNSLKSMPGQYTNLGADHINGQTSGSLNSMIQSLSNASDSEKAAIGNSALAALSAKSHERVKPEDKALITQLAQYASSPLPTTSSSAPPSTTPPTTP